MPHPSGSRAVEIGKKSPGRQVFLAAVLPEGMPKGSTILNLSPPGSGKTTMLLQFVGSALVRGENAIFITTDSPPREILSKMDSLSFDASVAFNEGRLMFIDCYSWRLGGGIAMPGILSVSALDDLSSLSIHMSEALLRMGGGPAVAFDSITTLTLHSSPISILKFLEVIFAKFKSAGATVMASMEKGVHEENFVTAVKYMLDGIIESKFEEENGDLARYMRVFSMKNAPHVTKWTKFRIAENGISFG